LRKKKKKKATPCPKKRLSASGDRRESAVALTKGGGRGKGFRVGEEVIYVSGLNKKKKKNPLFGVVNVGIGRSERACVRETITGMVREGKR